MLHSIEMVEMPQPAQGLPKIAKKGRSGGRVLRSRSRAPFFLEGEVPCSRGLLYRGRSGDHLSNS